MLPQVYKLLSGPGGCIRPDGRRRVFLDVGANFGWYTTFAAVMGCRVIAWEPVPLFRAFLRLALQYNNVSHLVELRQAVVSDAPPGTRHKLHVPNRCVGAGGWGCVCGGGACAGLITLRFNPNDPPFLKALQFSCCCRTPACRGIWGTAGIDGLNIDPAINNYGHLQQIEVG